MSWIVDELMFDRSCCVILQPLVAPRFAPPAQECPNFTFRTLPLPHVQARSIPLDQSDPEHRSLRCALPRRSLPAFSVPGFPPNARAFTSLMLSLTSRSLVQAARIPPCATCNARAPAACFPPRLGPPLPQCRFEWGASSSRRSVANRKGPPLLSKPHVCALSESPKSHALQPN